VAEDSSAADRLPGSLAAVAAAAAAGAAIVRVHDVAETVRYLRMARAIAEPAPAAAHAAAR
jgi:dihydropteroate synthase